MHCICSGIVLFYIVNQSHWYEVVLTCTYVHTYRLPSFQRQTAKRQPKSSSPQSESIFNCWYSYVILDWCLGHSLARWKVDPWTSFNRLSNWRCCFHVGSAALYTTTDISPSCSFRRMRRWLPIRNSWKYVLIIAPHVVYTSTYSTAYSVIEWARYHMLSYMCEV